jgi:hypothetical protein
LVLLLRRVAQQPRLLVAHLLGQLVLLLLLLPL